MSEKRVIYINYSTTIREVCTVRLAVEFLMAAFHRGMDAAILSLEGEKIATT